MIRPTSIIESDYLSDKLGVHLVFASETFQHTGSFKFRAAYHVVQNVSHSTVITASSGNFGQALAYACAVAGKTCIVVMPETSAAVKVNNVRRYGARVEFTNVARVSRHERVIELSKLHPEAYLASPYDDELVIRGNSTLGEEIVALSGMIDDVIVPIGGGGLVSGIIRAASTGKQRIAVWGAEPLLANDAARSLAAGRLIGNTAEPQTIADGARSISLGLRNWEILRNGIQGIIEVPEVKISEAMRLLFYEANLKAEPTGALSLAAILARPKAFQGRRICCIVSGGNVDFSVYRRLLEE